MSVGGASRQAIALAAVVVKHEKECCAHTPSVYGCCRLGKRIGAKRTATTAEVALCIWVIAVICSRCRMDAGNHALRRFFLAKTRNEDVAPATVLCERSFDFRGYH